jgi:hypothetical protein
MSAKLVPTFADRGVSRSERGGSPTTVIYISRPEPLLVSSSSSVSILRYRRVAHRITRATIDLNGVISGLKITTQNKAHKQPLLRFNRGSRHRNFSSQFQAVIPSSAEIDCLRQLKCVNAC